MAMCRDVVDNIIAYIEAKLDNKTLKELEKHIDKCPACVAFIKTYRKMLELAGRLREKTFVTPEIRKRLKEVLQSQIKS